MNKLTPNELKELAEYIEPETTWRVINNLVSVEDQTKDDIVMGDESVAFLHYEPYKPTERGKAQLCDVIFALMDKGQVCFVDDDSYTEPSSSLDTADGKMYNCCGKTKADAILRLAHDVLIKKGE